MASTVYLLVSVAAVILHTTAALSVLALQSPVGHATELVTLGEGRIGHTIEGGLGGYGLENSKVDVEELKTRFFMPWLDKPKKKGPNAYELEVREDVTHPFHHLHVCHKKGPNGSPTYDNAGYQLDWKKVDKWMKPQGYSKSRAVGGMMKALKEAEELEKLLYSVFFTKGKGPDGASRTQVKDYIMDHMSKDLGLPWHQVKLKKNILAWEKKGFPQHDGTTWWHEPNAEEQKRMLKMMEGASLRKDL